MNYTAQTSANTQKRQDSTKGKRRKLPGYIEANDHGDRDGYR
jgi:hypothetical protein